jgi:hypothetical protein
MTNEQDHVEVANNEELDLELVEETHEEAPVEEKKEEKTEFTPEQKLARLKRMASKLEKEIGVPQEVKQEPKSQSSELGYAEKAYLQGNDIRGNEEFSIVQKYVKDTGKKLEELVDEATIVGKLIRSEIKELRETKATDNATPKGTKRSTSTPKDSVDYWIKKPFDEVPQEMKIAVVNRRIELEKSKNPFSN